MAIDGGNAELSLHSYSIGFDIDPINAHVIRIWAQFQYNANKEKLIVYLHNRSIDLLACDYYYNISF